MENNYYQQVENKWDSYLLETGLAKKTKLSKKDWFIIMMWWMQQVHIARQAQTDDIIEIFNGLENKEYGHK